MELEIKVMWCKGLSAFNFFQNLAVYAAVSIIPDDKTLKLTKDQKQEQKTPVDQGGNGNPEWNYIMKFDLSPSNISSNLRHLSLLFEVRNHGQFFGDKEIGEVRVPLKDLVESVGVGFSRLVSYEVRGTDGKHNGVLDFSYKVINRLDLGNCLSDQPIQVQISGYGQQSVTSDSGRIYYPIIDCEICLNPGDQPPPPPIWAPPPLPYFAPPPPPPPRFPPPHPAPLQQPYALPPAPYGEPYWAYQTPPPNHQQPNGGGCDYCHW